MAFFQDLGKKISEGVQDASKKTSEMIEIGKLNAAISTEEAAIDAAKRQLGEKVFTMFTAGESVPEVMNEDLRNIGAHLQTIAEIEAQISKIKAASEAGKVENMAADTAATPAGGSNAATGRFCSGCGAQLGEGVQFCAKCGNKVE